MSLASAVIAFDVALALAIGVDFAVLSRRRRSVIARVPAAVAAIVLVALVRRVDAPLAFAAVTAVVTPAALFGYANALAFLTRGITFSIIHNHAKPPAARRPDVEFIGLEERLEEMRGYGWVEAAGGTWTLLPAGRRAVRLRRALLRLLGAQAVG